MVSRLDQLSPCLTQASKRFRSPEGSCFQDVQALRHHKTFLTPAQPAHLAQRGLLMKRGQRVQIRAGFGYVVLGFGARTAKSLRLAPRGEEPLAELPAPAGLSPSSAKRPGSEALYAWRGVWELAEEQKQKQSCSTGPGNNLRCAQHALLLPAPQPSGFISAGPHLF